MHLIGNIYTHTYYNITFIIVMFLLGHIRGHIIYLFSTLSLSLSYLIITLSLTFFPLFFLSPHCFILKCCNSSILSSSFYLNSYSTHFIYYKNFLFLFHSIHILPIQKCEDSLFFFSFGGFLILYNIFTLG